MINEACLIGRVGKIDSKTTKNGTEMTTISVATSRQWVDGNGQQQKTTTWHNVNFFNKLSEIAKKYSFVGQLIYVRGEINNKQILTGERQGQWNYSITGNLLKFLEYEKKDKAPKDEGESELDPFDDDSIPF